MPERAARLLFQLPHSSRVYCALEPANQWGWPEVFANKTNYLLETLLWQNSYDPKKKAEHKANRPKLFLPDFMQNTEISKEAEKHTVDDIKAILSRPRK